MCCRKLVEISQQKENDLNSTIQAYETKLQERDMQIKDVSAPFWFNSLSAVGRL
jgi:hypothetical protein